MIFARYDLEILSVPSSVTPCERVFSNIGDILMNDKRNLGFETLNSLMIIRINSLFLKQDELHSLSFIQNKFDQVCSFNYEEYDAQFEDDPLIYF